MFWVQYYIRSLLATTFDPGTHLTGIIEVKLTLEFGTVNQSKYCGLMALLNLISKSSIKVDILACISTETDTIL